MFKNMWKSFIRNMELIAYQRTLRECYSILDQEHINRIRNKIEELSAK